MYISSISSISSDMPRLEEIRCINCGELNYLREDRPSGESEKCGVCGKSLHLKDGDYEKAMPILLGKIESIEPAGDIILGDFSTYVEICNDSEGGYIVPKSIAKELEKDMIGAKRFCKVPRKPNHQHLGVLEKAVKDSWSYYFSRSIDAEILKETAKHNSETEATEPIDADDVFSNRCHMCGAPEGSYHAAVCPKSNNRKPATENKFKTFDEQMKSIIKSTETGKGRSYKQIGKNLIRLKELCEDTELETEVTELINGEWVTRNE